MTWLLFLWLLLGLVNLGLWRYGRYLDRELERERLRERFLRDQLEAARSQEPS